MGQNSPKEDAKGSLYAREPLYRLRAEMFAGGRLFSCKSAFSPMSKNLCVVICALQTDHLDIWKNPKKINACSLLTSDRSATFTRRKTMVGNTRERILERALEKKEG